MRQVLALISLAFFGATAPAVAAECPGNPNALGTSRTLVIDSTEHARLGTMQYAETLPLADHEVVLTFDDGPLPPYTNRILDILASECVKANYFIVGRMAQSFPDLVRRIHNEGHTIGTHSQTHPLTFHKMPLAMAQKEVEDGIASVTAALGDASEVAPFFRIPGLLRAAPVESYLASHALVTWSADFPADDWFKRIKASEVLRRALQRIEAHGKGILLLHDIQPATALALPTLLKELKARGYRIVHVVPSGPGRPKTVTDPQDWFMHGKDMRVADMKLRVPARPQNFGVGASFPFGPRMIVAPALERPRQLAAAGDMPLPGLSPWPRIDLPAMPADMARAAASGPSLDWPQTMRDQEATLLRSEAVTWPMRPAIRVSHPRPAAAKPKKPAKPAPAHVAASGLSQWLFSFASAD
jgi:peptidoglycan/xylan/chitin deacetylase (PgdA/CDA1 family)